MDSFGIQDVKGEKPEGRGLGEPEVISAANDELTEQMRRGWQYLNPIAVKSKSAKTNQQDAGDFAHPTNSLLSHPSCMGSAGRIKL